MAPLSASSHIVIPTKVGIQRADAAAVEAWTPTFVGVTKRVGAAAMHRADVAAVETWTPAFVGVTKRVGAAAMRRRPHGPAQYAAGGCGASTIVTVAALRVTYSESPSCPFVAASGDQS
jgi:hypothetical protein